MGEWHHSGLRPWGGYKRTKGESELGASLLLSRCPDCGHHVTSCSAPFPTMVNYTPSNRQGQNHPLLSWFYHLFSRQQQGKKLIHAFLSSHLSPANSIPYLQLCIFVTLQDLVHSRCSVCANCIMRNSLAVPKRKNLYFTSKRNSQAKH